MLHKANPESWNTRQECKQSEAGGHGIRYRVAMCACVCDDDDDKLGKWWLNNGCGRRRALLVISPDQGVSL